MSEPKCTWCQQVKPIEMMRDVCLLNGKHIGQICRECTKDALRDREAIGQCAECGKKHLSAGIVLLQGLKTKKKLAQKVAIAVRVNWRAWYDPLLKRFVVVCPKHKDKAVKSDRWMLDADGFPQSVLTL